MRSDNFFEGASILHFLKYWLPPFLYMALVFYLSSLPKPPSPQLDWANVDKLYHLLEYAVLGFLVARVLFNTSYRIFRFSPWISVLLLVCLYAASDEWHQSFVPNRFASVSDWIADCFGCILGALAMYAWYRLSQARLKTSCS